MSLLAESLVEEWLNRDGFFTVRGVKHGVDEVDLLAVRPAEAAEKLEAWHVEVQASFRPIGYISPLSERIKKETNKPGGTAWKRTDDLLHECVDEWVRKKFHAVGKVAVRNRAWPGLQWKLVFAHAATRYPAELELIAAHGISLLPFQTILHDLCHHKRGDLMGAAGTDIADIVRYYAQTAGADANTRPVRSRPSS